MAKIDLPTISSGYASNTTFNTTFTTIENEFQQKVLYRDNPTGEPNSMQNDLDMNSNDINNVKDITMTGDFTVDGVDYLTSMQTLYDNYLALVDRVTISTDSPSGGSDGDIWFKVT
ncbi:putative structural protein [Methylophilales phage MEP402]|nr:putative structural protein [Methylophilales phage MEP402]